jgi:glucose/arabinose dehydrogenase/cytochrome c5
MRNNHGLALLAIAASVLGLVSAPTLSAADEPGLLLPASALPEHESDLDHAGLIRQWSKTSFERGEKIYERVCHSCHGDLNLRGSLPDALSFGEGRFRHGSDPYRMYESITRGWGKMPPQPALVPQEKYDVIHYLREAFLAPHNPEQLFAVSEPYLASLPKGRSRGPAPVRHEPWKEMDYGRFLITTIEVADPARRAQVPRAVGERDAVAPDANLAYKGIAVRLDPGPGGVAAGAAWVVFEHDTLRLAGGWTGQGFIDWEGINFNTRHVVRPRTVGDVQFELADGPGWANPLTGDFADARITGLDGRRFGPLPREWGRYRGVYRHGEQVVIAYSVGDAPVLELHELESLDGTPVLVRTLNIGRSSRDLILRVANHGAAVAVTGISGMPETDGRFITLRIGAAQTPARLALRLARAGTTGLDTFARRAAPPRDLAPFTRGGPAQWPDRIETPVVESAGTGGFAWSRLSLPTVNPWKSRLRPSGLDFLPGGDAAVVCTWDGDVWRVDGLTGTSGTVTWRRLAAGLFQPLGIAVRSGEIFVTCRDQLVRLHDLNGDGEIDHHEAFNSDHQVTEHFHEFAMGLQVDAAGNFYYAKSARHARAPLVPQHGTLLKVSQDGSRTEIIANGFRAANGVCLNPDGSFFVTDQEGHWMPANRINRVVPGRFYGNMWSYGAPVDESDAAMAPPLCWIDKRFDRSPAELLWLEHAAWGGLRGALVNLSYGHGRIELVLRDPPDGERSAAVVALPIPDFPTGIMRGRLHSATGDLYVCGLSAWATSQTLQEGGLYRVRRTDGPAHLPVAWTVAGDAIELTLSDPVDVAVAARPDGYRVTAWGLQRSAKYGSARVEEHELQVTNVTVTADGRKLRLTVPGLQPTPGIEIVCRLRDSAGREFLRVVHGTIHSLPGATR